MNSTNKVDVEKALTMSLDEYAQESGLYVSSFLKQPQLNNGYKIKSKFDRIEEDMDQDEEEDLLQINVNDNDGLLKEIKEESNVTDDNIFDLRNRINGQHKKSGNSIDNNSTPKANSQQWRLIYPNNTYNNRAPGMPPLISNDAVLSVCNLNQHKNVAENNYDANRDNNYRNNNNNNRNNNNRRNKKNRNNNNGYRNHNRNQHYNYTNSGRNNLNNNNKRNQMNNSINQSSYQNCQNNQQYRMIDGTIPNDMSIVVNSSSVRSKCDKPVPLMSIAMPSIIENNGTTPFGNAGTGRLESDNNGTGLLSSGNLSTGLLSSGNLSTVLLSSSNGNVLPSSSNNSTALLPSGNSFNLGLNQFATVATTLLDTLRKGILTEDTKPKYDMRLQKEIHTIQRKPMIYKCPNGEVISSDGPGLDLGFKPTTTGISLNQRFA